MSRTSRWSRGLPLLRSLFPRARGGERRRDAELNVESLEERQVFTAPELTLNITGSAQEQTDYSLSGATITDDGNITGMTVSLSGVLDAASESISIDPTVVSGLGLTLTVETDTELTFTGTASPDDYQTLLRAITYLHSSDTPDESSQRTLSVSVVDDEATPATDSADGMFSVLAVNDAPFITLAGKSYSIDEDTTIDFASKISIGDIDAGATSKLTVHITVGSGGGVLGLSGTLPSGVDVSKTSDDDDQEWTGTIADLNTALGLLQYTPAKNAVGASEIDFQIVDGGNTGSGGPQSASDQITITTQAVDDKPELTDPTSTPVIYVEDTAPVQVTNSIVVVEHDGDLLQSATISITGGAPGDALGLSGPLAGWSINTSTPGVLVLTAPVGGVNAATMQAALRLVTYSTTSQNPSASRTIEFVVTDVGTSPWSSDPLIRAVTFTGVNDAPVLAGGGSAVYVENASTAVVIAPSLTATDPDGNDQVSSVKIAITGGFEAGKDLLSISGGLSSADWSGTYNATTGEWNITAVGTKTIADAQTLLRTIRFSSTTDNPLADRTITFSVTDVGLETATTTATVSITPVNDAPVLTAAGATVLEFEEGDAATIIAGGITLTDVDSTPASATVTIRSGTYHKGEDVLAVDGALPAVDWTAVFDPNTGVLTITAGAGATTAQMENVLRRVTYFNPSQNPDDDDRYIDFIVRDSLPSGNGDYSAKATYEIEVERVNDLPVVTGDPTPITFTEGNAAKAVFTGLTVSDYEDEDLRAKVVITNFSAGNDYLAWDASKVPGGWGGSAVTFDTSTGILTITGPSSATSAQLQAILRSVTFENKSQNPTTAPRGLTLTVWEGSNTSDSASFSMTVNIVSLNDPPVLDVNQPITVSEGGTVVLNSSQLHIADYEQTNSQLKYTLVVALGSLAFGKLYNGSTQIGIGSSFTQADINAGNIKYVHGGLLSPLIDGDLFAFTITDGTVTLGTLVPYIATIEVDNINDAPVISDASKGGNAHYVENSAGVVVSSTITVSDEDNDTFSKATVTFTGNHSIGNDKLTADATLLASLGLKQNFDSATGVLTIEKDTNYVSEGDLTLVLRSVMFSNSSDNPTTSTRTVAFQVFDTGTGPLSSNGASTSIEVEAVNDAPTVTGTTTRSVDEDTTLTFGAGSITIGDVDAGTSNLTVTLAVSQGSLGYNTSLPGLTVIDKDGSNGTLSFQGTLANLQAFLDSLSYKANLNYNGSDSLVVTLNDNGHTGTGGAKSAAAFSVAITVNAVNDAPTVAGTTTQSVDEDTTLTFGAGNITIGDVDAGSGKLTVTLAVSKGSLGYNTSLPGLEVVDKDGSDGTLSFKGTLTDLQAFLNSLTYKGNLNYNGSDSLVVVLNDNGNTGGGDQLAAPFAVAITVNAVNDAPTVTGTTSQTVDEDTTLNFGAGAVTIGDVDAGSGKLTVTLGVSHGSLGYNTSLPGLTPIDDNGSDGTLSFKGSLTDLQALLDSLSYKANLNYNGSDSLVVTLEDNKSTGTGGSKTADPFSVAITVNAVNDAPTVTGKASQSVNEDATLTFGAGNITIGDVDAGSGELTVTLAVSKGSLGYNTSLPGLTPIDKDGSDGTLSFQGSLTDLQALLNSLTYQGNLNYNGSDSLVVTLNDNGNTGTGGAQTAAPFAVAINVNAVNDAPTIAAPTSVTVNEGSTIVFTGGNAITVADLDIGPTDTNNVTVKVEFTDGEFTIDLSGVAASDDDATDGDVTFTGTLSEVNAALATLQWKFSDVDQNGDAQLKVTVNDGGNIGSGGTLSASAKIDLHVAAVNDAPTVSTPSGPVTVAEDKTVTFSGISVADIDVSETSGGVLEVTLKVSQGTLLLTDSISGLTIVDGDGSDGTLTWKGSAGNLNLALAKLQYQGKLDYFGADALQITVDDLGNTGAVLGVGLTDSATLAINVTPVNDPPVLDLDSKAGGNDATGKFTEDGAATPIAPNATIADVDDTQLSQMVITLTNREDGFAEGLLLPATPLGVTVNVDDQAGVLTITLTGLADKSVYQNYLRQIAYLNSSQNPSEDVRVVTVTVTDASGDAGATQEVRLDVVRQNDPPTIAAPVSVTTNEDAPVTFNGANQIQVADVDSAGLPVSVTLTVGHGTLTIVGSTAALDASKSDFDGSDGTITLVGSIDDVNAALLTLQYLGDADFNTENGAPSETLKVVVSDLGNGSSKSGAPVVQTAKQDVTINVNAVNDAPEIASPGAVTTKEDTAYVFNKSGSTISIVDDATESNHAILVSLSVTRGTIQLTSFAGLTFGGDGNGSAAFTVSGTVAAINAALATLRFTPDADDDLDAVLSIHVSDEGGTGLGGALSSDASVLIDVLPQNDPPVVTGSGPFSIDEDKTLHFGSSAVNVSDVDAGAGNVQVTVSVAHGTLTLGSTTGLIGDFDGSDGLLVITGTLADVNAALDSLSYTPLLNYNGGDVLHVEVDDLGNTGAGTYAPTVLDQAMTINPVNDNPTITQPSNINVNEDETYSFAPGELSIGDVDVDEGTGQLTVTIQVDNGSLIRVGGAIAGLTEGDADGSDGSLTWTGTLAALNAALAQLRYQGDLNYFGPDTLTITVNDGGNTGASNGPGNGVTVGTTAINVIAVNDAPTVDLNGPGAGQDHTVVAPEQTGTPIAPNAVLADVDDTQLSSMTITLTNVQDGTFEHLNAMYSGSLVVSLTTVGNTIVLTFTGVASIAEYQAALRGVEYYNGSDNPDETPRVVTVVVNDGELDSITRTVTIDVERVNDAPTIAAPGSTVVAEDVTLPFTGANQIVVSDVDAASGNLTVTLKVLHGALTLGSTTGLTGDFNGSDGDLTLIGSLADINAALAGLVYQGDANFNTPYGGPEQLTVHVDDDGNSSHQGAPDPQSAQVVIPITVTAVNDPPSITAPNTVSLQEDGSILISSVGTLSITDPDEHESGVARPLTVTVNAQHGVLLVDAGAYTALISGQGTSSLVIHGTEAEVNAVLAKLRFRPDADFNDYLGAAGVDVVVSDNGNTGAGPVGTASAHIDVHVAAVNDAPTVNAPAGFTIDEDAPNAPIPAGSAFVVNDIDVADADPNAVLRVTLTAVHGTLVVGSPNGALVTGDGTVLVTIEGTVAQINAALASLLFTPDLNFNDGRIVSPDPGARITISVDDLGNTGLPNGVAPPTSTVLISVRAQNDAPTIDAPANVHASEDTPFVFTGPNAIHINDPDADEVGFGDPQITVVLEVQRGRLGLTWTPLGTPGEPVVSGDGTRKLTISGSRDDVNALLLTLAYTPDLNFNDNIGAETLTIDVTDNGNVGAGGEQKAHAAVPVFVAAQNDAPTIVAPTEVSTDEDASVAVGGIVVSDVDAREHDVYAAPGYVKPNEVTVTLTAQHGTLSVTVIPMGDPLDPSDDTIVTGQGTGVLTITGRLDYVNAALASLRFTPELNFNDNLAILHGDAKIDVFVCDNGNTGAGSVGIATASINVKIAPVNDAPTVGVPGHQTTSEDAPLAFTGPNAIVIDDVDATETTIGDQISVALTVAHGSLSVVTAGLSVTVTSDGAGGLTISGSLAEVKLALATLTFTPTAFYSSDPSQPAGFGRIDVVVNDLGNTGKGGAKSASGQVTIQIDAVANDPTLDVTQPTDGTEGVWLPLTISALSIDTDGSETVTIYLTNVPLNAVLSAGVNQGGGTWKLTQAQLAGLKIRVDDQNDAGGAITGRAITVKAVTTERDNGDEADTVGGFALTIKNSLPVFTVPGGAVTINEGGVVQISGSFTDLGRYDTHVVEINWGDGSPNTILHPAGSDAFDENAGGLTTNYKFAHIYLNETGTTSPITVTIRDEVGGDTLNSYVVTVENVTSGYTGSTDALTVNEQQPLKVQLPFADPGKNDTFTVRVHFEDGTQATFSHSQLNVVPGVVTYDPSVVDANGNLMPTGVTTTTFWAAINHKYVLPDIYKMTIDVRDSDGAPFTTVAVITVIVADLPGVGVELPTAPGAPPLLVPPVVPTLQLPLMQLPGPAVISANLGAGGQTGGAEGQQNETPSTLKIQVVVEKISRFRGKALSVEFTDILFANQINLVLERVGKLAAGTYRVTLSAAGMPALVHEFSIASTDGSAAQRSVKTLWQEVQTREQAGGQNRGFQFLDSAQHPAPAPAGDQSQPGRAAEEATPTGDSVGAGAASGDVTATDADKAPLAPQPTSLQSPADAGSLTAGSVAALAALNAMASLGRKPSTLRRLMNVFRGFL